MTTPSCPGFLIPDSLLLIYGKGKVSQGLQSFCDLKGYEYEICDDSDAPDDFERYEKIIPSPGVPGTHPIYETDKIVCELDFLSAHIPEGFKKICVTGTDGKSTVCHITHQLLLKSLPDTPVYLTGNFDEPLGTTLTNLLKKGEIHGILVIEVSSFMSHAMKVFESDITAITNLQPDHLDWHRNIDEYYTAKRNLLEQTSGIVIMPEKLPISVSHSRIRNFSTSTPTSTPSDYVEMSDIVVRGMKTLTIDQTQFIGPHNASNLLISLMIADELGIDREITTSKVRDIKPLSHRMEVFLEKDEVRWIDDGKSTSSQAQRAALASMEDKKTILIAGGKDKGDEFEGIEDLWKQKCKHIFLLGEMADKLSRKSSKCQIPSTKCGSLKEMVRLTRDIAQSGDTILFSPGCSSLDMFENWKVRAEQFRDSVLSVDEQ